MKWQLQYYGWNLHMIYWHKKSLNITSTSFHLVAMTAHLSTFFLTGFYTGRIHPWVCRSKVMSLELTTSIFQRKWLWHCRSFSYLMKIQAKTQCQWHVNDTSRYIIRIIRLIDMILPWEPATFNFRGYNPYFEGLKPSVFMVLGSKGVVLRSVM